jgi:hypothetical protein
VTIRFCRRRHTNAKVTEHTVPADVIRERDRATTDVRCFVRQCHVRQMPPKRTQHISIPRVVGLFDLFGLLLLSDFRLVTVRVRRIIFIPSSSLHQIRHPAPTKRFSCDANANKARMHFCLSNRQIAAARSAEGRGEGDEQMKQMHTKTTLVTSRMKTDRITYIIFVFIFMSGFRFGFEYG